MLASVGRALAWEPTGDNCGRVKTMSFDVTASGDFSFILTDGNSDSDPITMYYDVVQTPMVLSMILTAKSADLPLCVYASAYWRVYQVRIGSLTP
jgi:hypothetical protein